ncbi:kinase-like protein, partial [Cylindrobasidium torrendii FP15055 ss-10]
KDCFREAIVWKRLQHKNIQPFLGIEHELYDPSLCLISPWREMGSLNQFLKKNPMHGLIDVVLDILHALDYLHTLEPPVVHADLRGGNIVNDDHTCMVTDFGVSRISQSIRNLTATPHGTYRWMPPEAFNEETAKDSYHPPRDMYSFACTVIEIYTNDHPFSEIKHDNGVVGALARGRRAQWP